MPDIKLITENLADELIPGIVKASAIYIMTSFVMESGVKLLAPYLKTAVERGAEVKVLGGDYLFVTHPNGLRRLVDIDERIEARLWRSNGASFHPKAEFHHAAAKSYQAVLEYFQQQFLLGITATPETEDGLHCILLVL